MVVVVVAVPEVLKFMKSTLQDDQLMFREDANPVQPHAVVVLADEVLVLQDEAFSAASQSLLQMGLGPASGNHSHHPSHSTQLSVHSGSWGMNYVNDQNGRRVHGGDD